MAKDLKYYLTVWLRDQATAGLDKVRKGLLRVGDAAKAVRQGPGAALGFGGPIAGLLLGGLSIGVKAVQAVVGIVAGVVGSVVHLVVTAISTIVKTIEGAFGLLFSLLGKVGKVAGVAVGAATAAFVLFTRQVVMAGDALWDMSKRTGLSIKFLSEMKPVLDKNDASLESVRTAIRALGRAVEGAVRGEKEYVDVWRQLGVSLRDQHGKLRTSEGLFVAVVDALRRIPNELVRAGAAQRIFGRSADELMPLINNVTESLAEQRAEAQRLGATWSNRVAAAADRVADAWIDLGTAWAALKREFLGPFLRPIAQALESLATWVASNREQVAAWGQEAAAWAEHVAKALVEKVGAAWQWLSTRAFSWDALKAGAVGALQLVRDQAGNVVSWLGARLTVLKTHALDIADEVMSYVNRRWGETIDKMALSLKRIGARTEAEARAKPTITEKAIGAVLPGVTAEQMAAHRIVPGYGGPAGPVQQAEIQAGRGMYGLGGLLDALSQEAARRAGGLPAAAAGREAERQAAEAAAAMFAKAFSEALAQQVPQIVGAAFPAKPGAGAPQGLAGAVLAGLNAAASMNETLYAALATYKNQLDGAVRRLSSLERSAKRLNQSKR